MPHSTTESNSSIYTFDLDDQDGSQNTLHTPSTQRTSDPSDLAMTTLDSSPGEVTRLDSPPPQKRDSRLVTDGYTAYNIRNSQHVEEILAKARDHFSSERRITEASVVNQRDTSEISTRDKILRASPIFAELKTNVIIKDEFTLVTDLSYHLAQRYSRPESCVMIKVDHSACLALGGAFDPCYILNISTIPSQMTPAMNQRNAALLQSFMADILSVLPDRGIVKFQPVPDECFATNGITVYAELEREDALEQLQHAVDPPKSTSTTPHGKGFSSHHNDRRGQSNGERPSTSHGTKRASDLNGLHANGVNGLHANGVSAESTSNDGDNDDDDEQRLPNGRLVTIATGPPELTAVEKASKSLTPPIKSSLRTNSSLLVSKSLQPAAVTSSTSSLNNSTKSGQTPSPTPSTKEDTTDATTITDTARSEIRSKPAHLENISTLRKKFEPSTDIFVAAAAANAANGRHIQKGLDSMTSTTSAPQAPTYTGMSKNSPGMKSSLAVPPIPPSTPDLKTRTRSLRSFKLGKRKNIFSMFRSTLSDDSSIKTEE